MLQIRVPSHPPPTKVSWTQPSSSSSSTSPPTSSTYSTTTDHTQPQSSPTLGPSWSSEMPHSDSTSVWQISACPSQKSCTSGRSRSCDRILTAARTRQPTSSDFLWPSRSLLFRGGALHLWLRRRPAKASASRS